MTGNPTEAPDNQTDSTTQHRTVQLFLGDPHSTAPLFFDTPPTISLSTAPDSTAPLFLDTPHRTGQLFLDGPHPRLPLHRTGQPARSPPPTGHPARPIHPGFPQFPHHPNPQPRDSPPETPAVTSHLDPSHRDNTPCLPATTASIDPSVSTRTPAPGQTRPAFAAERGRQPRPRTLVATLAKPTWRNLRWASVEAVRVSVQTLARPLGDG